MTCLNTEFSFFFEMLLYWRRQTLAFDNLLLFFFAMRFTSSSSLKGFVGVGNISGCLAFMCLVKLLWNLYVLGHFSQLTRVLLCVQGSARPEQAWRQGRGFEVGCDTLLPLGTSNGRQNLETVEPSRQMTDTGNILHKFFGRLLSIFRFQSAKLQLAKLSITPSHR